MHANHLHLFFVTNKITLLLLSMVLLLSVRARSQSSEDTGKITFQSSELNQKSKELTGDASNWAVITSLAEYDVSSNTFTLSRTDLRQIDAFKANHQKLNEIQAQFQKQIEEGATVFAPEATEKFTELKNTYQGYVRNGEISQAIETARKLSRQIEVITTTTKNNRTEYVSAILAKKAGEVFRRPGYIGDWVEAEVRDLLERSDGIKTEEESYAFLNFTNGSTVTISPSTIAIVKEMRVDKLTNYTETEVTINEGGLLSSLSDEARRNGNFTVNTDESTSEVRSARFWASKDDDEERVTFSNYDGEANVTANNSTVTLQAYQGTIVVRGQSPLPPTELLPAPVLKITSSDTVIYSDQFEASWEPIENADYYEIDHSPSRNFDTEVTTFTRTGPSATIPSIKMGDNYIRVRAYDENGLRGNDSDPYLILRNIDTQPPAIFLSNGKQSIYYSDEETYTIIGFSEPGSTVKVNEEEAKLDDDGRFSATVQITNDIKEVVITSKDDSGNATKVSKQIVPIDESQLFKLSWSSQIQDLILTSAEKISVSGTAYSPLEVVFEFNDDTVIAQCGIDGSWSASFRPRDAREVTLLFRFKDSKKIVAQRTYTIR